MVVMPSCLWTTEIQIRLTSSPVTLLVSSSLEFVLVALQVLSWRRTSVGPSAGQQALFSTKQGLHIILLITNAVHILLCALQLSGNTYAHSDNLRYVVLAYSASVLQLVLFRDIKTLERMALNKAVHLVRPLVKLLAGFTTSYTLALAVLYACTNSHLPVSTKDGCSTVGNGGYVIISLILFAGILRVNLTMCLMQGKQIPDHPLIALSIKRLHLGLLVTNVLTWYFLISSVIFVITHTALSIQFVSIAIMGFRLSSTFLCWYAWTPIRLGWVAALVGVMVIPSEPKESPMEQLSDTYEDLHLTFVCASQRLASIREDGDRLEPELKRAKIEPPDAELLSDLNAILMEVGWEPGLVADDTHKGHDQLQHHLLQRQHDSRKRRKQKVKQKEKQQRQLQEQLQQQKLQQQRLHLQPEDQQHQQHQQNQDHRQHQQQNQRREEQEHQQRPQRHQRREEQNLLQQHQQQEQQEHERGEFEHQQQQEKQHLEEHAMRLWPEVQAFLWQQRESRPPQEPQDTVTIHIPSGASRGQHPSITVTVPRQSFEAGIISSRPIAAAQIAQIPAYSAPKTGKRNQDPPIG